MRIFYMGKRIDIPRKRNGRFRTKKATGVIAMFVIVGTFGWIVLNIPKTNPQTPIVLAEDTLEAKIDTIKKSIVQELYACETSGVVEPQATIILDANNQMSIGKAQWQIESVQYYVKKIYQKEISRTDAIEIAIDRNKDISLDMLTTEVLFDTKNGWKNWLLCGKKLNIPTKIEIINQL